MVDHLILPNVKKEIWQQATNVIPGNMLGKNVRMAGQHPVGNAIPEVQRFHHALMVALPPINVIMDHQQGVTARQALRQGESAKTVALQEDADPAAPDR